jgi:hypothetical protein
MGCLRGALAPLYLKGRRAGKDMKRGRGKEMERGETFLGGWVWEEGELVKVGGVGSRTNAYFVQWQRQRTSFPNAHPFYGE